MTDETMTRTEAIEIVDRTHFEYLEFLRTGRCPACEALMDVREVERTELPPEREEAVRRTEQWLERPADGHLEWKVTHLPDCSWFYYWSRLPRFCDAMNIRVELFEVAFKRGEGAVTETVPIRVPDEIAPDNVPVIRRRPGSVFVEPKGYVPDLLETPNGPPVDRARLRWIAAMIIEEHRDTERLKALVATGPDVDFEPGELRGELLLAFRIAGEIVGFFEPELLNP